MTTQLKLYNDALVALGERELVTLTDNTAARRALDSAWDSGAAIKACLEQGYWNFAMRTAMFTKNVGFTASFGYANQFTKPSDFVRLAAMCSDEYFNSPLNQYTDEAGNWYADLDPIYVSYVSDSVNYGNNLAVWPESFTTYVGFYLADKACKRITGEADKVKKEMEKALVTAKSKDATNEPTKFLPVGGWVRARSGSTRRDGGRRGSLIG